MTREQRDLSPLPLHPSVAADADGPWIAPTVDGTLPYRICDSHALTAAEFNARVRAAGIPAAQGADALHRLFPGVATTKELVDEERWQLWQEIEKEITAHA